VQETTATRPAGRSAWLIDSADFWRLWFVGLVVFVVRWVETVAIGVFVYQDTGSAFIVAMMTMLRLLPMGLFGAFLGAIAERTERRTTLILVTASMVITSLTLAILAHLHLLEVWHLAVASFINGIGWATDNPVRRVMIGEAVGAAQMGTAMSVDVGANNASRMVGPTIGGLLLASVGIDGVFTLSVVLYAVAVVAACRVRYRNTFPPTTAETVLARIAEGLRLVRSDRRLIGTLTVTVIYNVFGWPFTSMVPVIGQDRLLLGPEGIGILASMDGIGAFAGAVLMAMFCKPRVYRTA
jgi:MFS family permease